MTRQPVAAEVPRVPPEGEPLEFVRNEATGTVHVHRWYRTGRGTRVTRNPSRSRTGVRLPSAVITGPGPEMLCGEHLKYGWPGARGSIVTYSL